MIFYDWVLYRYLVGRKISIGHIAHCGKKLNAKISIVLDKVINPENITSPIIMPFSQISQLHNNMIKDQPSKRYVYIGTWLKLEY